MTRKIYWPKLTKALLPAALALLLLLAAGCADDRDLITQTLDARNQALNTRNVEAYLELISPDYLKADPQYDARQSITQTFVKMASVQIQIFRRDIQFRSEDIAEVYQEYKMVFTTKKGKAHHVKHHDRFLMKRHGSRLFPKWLIYQGLDAPISFPKPPPTDGASAPEKEDNSQ